MTGNGPTVDTPDGAPLVVVSGEVTPEEVAALTAVVAALGAAGASAAEPSGAPVSQWAARARQLRGGHTPGRGGWRASALPR